MELLSLVGLRRKLPALLVLAGLWVACATAQAASLSPQTLRSFAFPVTFANGLTADLVVPAGSATNLRFEVGKIAIGELPVPLPEGARRRGRKQAGREFVRPADIGSHARLLLTGVVDGDGHPVSNTGNQVMIDAMVSPSSAAATPPPFMIPFDITNGTAFVDAVLPVQRLSDGSVRVQVLGVTLVDPSGQPFGVLGFQLDAARPTPAPRATPTPGGTPAVGGQCFVGSDCAGVSFPARQQVCCRFSRHVSGTVGATSWCPPDQFDPTTGLCAPNACVACVPAPATTPTPGACSDDATCSGACSVLCADGTAPAGECVRDRQNHCACSAECGAPAACGVGQCFDTVAFRCTGQACDANLHCPLPKQLCDLSGNRCPCAPPPPPHGRMCCQCKDTPHACFDFSFIDVQAICPPGCETYLGRECDASSESCVPLAACAADADCDDGNGCTIDRCTADGCTHDCVCVGPMGCGPGPGHGPH